MMKARIPKEYNDRLVPAEVAGTTYYLNFSTKAANQFMKLFDGKEVRDVMKNDGVDLDTLLDILAVLIQQGSKYIHYVHKEEVPSITADELGTVTNMDEVMALMGLMEQAIDKGSSQEIVAEAKKQEAGQANQASPGTSTGDASSA